MSLFLLLDEFKQDDVYDVQSTQGVARINKNSGSPDSTLEGNKLIFGGLTFYEMRCKPTTIHTKHVLSYWVVPQLCVLICCIVQQFPSYCMSEKVPN